MFSQFVDEEEDVMDEPIPIDPDMEDSVLLDAPDTIPESIIPEE